MATLNQRWWIPPPQPDESLRSVLARAAAFYRRRPHNIWRALIKDGPGEAGCVDCPRPWVLARLARALGVSAPEVFQCRLPDRPWLVKGQDQMAYCPICWNEDIAAGRPIYLRREWAHLLKMQCRIHDYPLLPCQENWATREGYPYVVPAFSSHEHAIFSLVDRFAHEFCATAFEGSPWPPYALFSFEQARNALILVNYSTAGGREFSVTHEILPFRKLRYGIRGPKLPKHVPTRVTWILFRDITNPTHRRAALWLVACNVLPDLPNNLTYRQFLYLRSGKLSFNLPVLIPSRRTRHRSPIAGGYDPKEYQWERVEKTSESAADVNNVLG